MSKDINELLGGSVEAITKELPKASEEELILIREAEVKGKNRTTLIEVVDAKIAAMSGDQDQDQDQDQVSNVADTTAADIATAAAKEAGKKKPKPSKGKIVEPKKSGETSAPPEGTGYKAVKNRIRNPHTGDVFTKAAITEVAKVDNWLEAQIDAGLIIAARIG